MTNYSTFPRTRNDQLNEPMFFGQNVNVARYDQQRYPQFEKLIEKQLSFFWRPEEVDLSMDRKDFLSMPAHEQHIFLSNLKYQILLDSVQGRSPNIALLPVVSLPELETWIETWSFSETVHSRSYTHIVRNVLDHPDQVFNDIVENEEIIRRAEAVTAHYDTFITMVQEYQLKGKPADRNLRRALMTLMASVFILEGLRFYVSFACSFSFAERAVMEGNAKIIKLIARDESLHKQGNQFMFQFWRSGRDDPEMKSVYEELKADGTFDRLFDDAVKEETEWADYLFKDGSMIGLSAPILKSYVAHIADNCRRQLGLERRYNGEHNPLPWMGAWLYSDKVQVAPQETEISSYLTGAVENDLSEADFSGFSVSL